MNKNIDNSIDSIKLQLRESIKLSENIVSNTVYIDWLEEFTERFPTFFDDQVKYIANEITSRDKENVEKLQYFYSAIARFARSNEIDSYSEDKPYYNEYYTIKFNNKLYEVKLICGQCSVYMLERVEKPQVPEVVIPFEQILNSVGNDKLMKLTFMLKMLKNDGVDDRQIKKIVEVVWKE